MRGRDAICARLSSGQYPPYVLDAASGSVNVIKSITLPNGTAYTFTYDPTYGTVSSITFPTGGYVHFVYGIRSSGTWTSQVASAVSTIVVTDVYLSTVPEPQSLESHWAYTYGNYTSSSPSISASVVDPIGNTTTYTGSAVLTAVNAFLPNSQPTFIETSRLIENGTTPLRRIDTAYPPGESLLPASVTTTDLVAELQQQVKYTYDIYSNVTEKDESDWYACSSGVCTPPAWLRKTFTTYYWTANSAYQTKHIVNEPYTVTITDGNNNPYAETTYHYDEFALVSKTGLVNHDDTNYPASVVGPRGNLTTKSECLGFSGTTCSNWLSTTYSYDSAGQLISETDPKGHITGYDYTDRYTGGTPSQPTDAYPTTVTLANGYTNTAIYDFFTGLKISQTDPNGNATVFSYNNISSGAPDLLNRIGQITLPQTPDAASGGSAASGWTRYFYTDTPGEVSVQTQTLLNSSGAYTQKLDSYDGLGRLVTTIQTDPEGNQEVDRAYDQIGRLYSVTTPYRTLTYGTYSVGTYLYDALNRPTEFYTSDGTGTVWCYAGVATTGQTNCHNRLSHTSGNWVDVTDQNGNDRQQVSNGLGQMTSIMEPPGTTQTSAAPSLETDYGYDPLNDLTLVTQWGGAYGSTAAVQRQFSYDSLSRLKSASNPETGITTYTYPLPSNLCSGDVSSLCTKTDARQITTTYGYSDSLNRLTDVTYSDGITPPRHFTYDVLSGSTVGNAVGHMTSETVGSSSNILSQRQFYGYDAMGRLTEMIECVYEFNCLSTKSPYHLAYGYDLAGNTVQYTNGVPTTAFTSIPANPASNYGNASATFNGITAPSILYTSTYDTMARPIAVTSSWSDATTHPAHYLRPHRATALPTVQVAWPTLTSVSIQSLHKR